MKRRNARRRLAAGLLAGATASMALAASAGAVPVPGSEPVGEARWGSLASDGDRIVAYVQPDGLVRVLDEGPGGGAFTVPVPPRCGEGSSSLAVGGGQLVLLCPAPDEVNPNVPLAAKRLDLATRAWHDIPGAEKWAHGEPLRLTGVGERWVAYQRFDRRQEWADWRSGQIRADDGAAAEAADLGVERLFAPMCGPLERPLPRELRDGAVFAPTVYADSHLVALNFNYELSVQRCGEPRATVLDTTIDMAKAGSGLLSWPGGVGRGDEPELFVYRTSCRLRYGWTVGQDSGWNTHTGRSAYVLRGENQRAFVERIALPGCAAPRPLTVAGERGGVRRVPASWWRGPSTAGGETRRMARPGAAHTTVAAGRGPLRLKLGTAALRVDWRTAADRDWTPARWASRDGRSWTIPRTATGAGRTVEVEVRQRAGETVRYLFRVARNGRR